MKLKNLGKAIAGVLSLSLLMTAAAPVTDTFAAETKDAYVVSSIKLDTSIDDYSDSETMNYTYYDTGFLKQIKSTGEVVMKSDDGNHVSDYTIIDKYTYTKKLFPKAIAHSYKEKIIEGGGDAYNYSWNRKYTVNSKGQVTKTSDDVQGEVKFSYKNGRLAKSYVGDYSKTYTYSNNKLSKLTVMLVDGDVTDKWISSFSYDDYGNINKVKTRILYTTNDEVTRDESDSQDYKLTYKDDRLVKVECDGMTYTFSYKKIKVSAENEIKVRNQQKTIVNQYASVDDLYMFY